MDQQDILSNVRNDTIMFEYNVHDMNRAVAWYQDILGLEIIYGPYECHTEFALPVTGARLALSLTDQNTKIQQGSKVFIATYNIRAIEAYLKEKGVKTQPIEIVENAASILWVEDTEGNYLAFEQWLNR